MSYRRAGDTISGPVKRDDQGRPLCRWCKGVVKPPRRTFCSQECVHQYSLVVNPGYLRRATFTRDHGVCARCGHDCRASGRSWEAHHIVAVAEGGGECGLDNIETLCHECHRAETKALYHRLHSRSPEVRAEMDALWPGIRAEALEAMRLDIASLEATADGQ